MKVMTRHYGVFEINSYYIIDEKTNDLIIVDPGGDAKYFIKEINELKLNPKAILVTHGHFDHISAVDGISEAFDVPVYAHKVEADVMADGNKNLSKIFGIGDIVAKATHYIDDGEEILIDNLFKIKGIMVPGHSENSMCYYFENEKMVFTGDTLMCMTVGRVDLYPGNSNDLVKNIKNKLYTLGDDTIVYPGHGRKTIVIDEKKHNPFI